MGLTTWENARARVAALSRSRTADDPDLVQARLDLAAARRAPEVERLAAHITRVVAVAPPITEADRDRLTALLNSAPVLRPMGSDGGAY